MAWDQKKKTVISDPVSSYDIVPPTSIMSPASITRVFPDKSQESWLRDGAKGIETRTYRNGDRRQETLYMSGVLVGKPRVIEETTAGVTKQTRLVYDESGNLLKKVIKETSGDASFEPRSDTLRIKSKTDNSGRLQNLEIFNQ